MWAMCCKRRQATGKAFSNEGRCHLAGRGGRTGRSDSGGPRTVCRATVRREDCSQTRCRENRPTRYGRDGRNPQSNCDFASFFATNKEITSCAREGAHAMQQLVGRILWEKRPLNSVNIATIFHSCAKTPHVLSPDVLNYLIESLHDLDMDGRAIGNTCYGLQGVKDSPIVRRLLVLIAAKVKRASDFNCQQIGNSLYGLQNLSDSPEVRSLLSALAPKVDGCREPFSSQGIASGCLGLRRLGDSDEVRTMFAAFAAKVEQMTETSGTRDAISNMPSTGSQGSLKSALLPHASPQKCSLDSQGAANVLYSLQSMEASPEVLRLIMAVSAQAQQLSKPMKAQEISIAFYGLRCIHNSPFEVRCLLSALAKQLELSTEALMPRHIATCLYGLRWLGDSDEARKVLSMLAKKTKMCTEPFDGHAVGNSLYGLQSFPCCTEVQTMLDALLPKVKGCRNGLSGQEIGNALYGFRSLNDSPEARRMLMALIPKLQQCGHLDGQAIGNALYGLHAFGHISEIALPIVKALTGEILQCQDGFRPQALSNALSGLQNMENCSEVQSILAALLPKLRQCNEPFTPAAIGNMLYNFRTVGNSDGTRKFLPVLAQKIRECSGSFQDHDIAHVFIGLSCLGGYEEVRGIFNAMAPHVEACQRLNAQDICICLNALKTLEFVHEIGAFLEVLAAKIKACRSTLHIWHFRKALQGVRHLTDSEEVQPILHNLADKAQHDGVPLYGTILEKFASGGK